ncbi:endonuclease/exonuclease/phosphatase family protein, partial [Acinetobacter baumannii]
MARSVRIVSVNVNGIRAAVRKGMTEWLDASGADILALQEVRATAEQLAEALPGWRIVN